MKILMWSTSNLYLRIVINYFNYKWKSVPKSFFHLLDFLTIGIGPDKTISVDLRLQPYMSSINAESISLSLFVCSNAGIDFKIRTIELDGKRVKLQIWWVQFIYFFSLKKKYVTQSSPLTVEADLMFSGTLQDRRGFAPSPQLTTEGPWWVCAPSFTSSSWIYLVHHVVWDLVCEDDYFSSQGIMLVYDISNEKSFENIKNWIRNIEEVSSEMKLNYIHKMNLFMVEVAFWQRYYVLRHNEPLNFSQHASSDVEKMILGNKCDMTDRRQVSKDRGEKVSLCSQSLLISSLKHIESQRTFPKCVAWHSHHILILLSWQLIMESSSWKPVQSRAWM